MSDFQMIQLQTSSTYIGNTRAELNDTAGKNVNWFEAMACIDAKAEALVDYARKAVASGNELTPSEVVMLTARSQAFLFHSQLTANIANRTAEGLQQLFQQQS